MSVLEADFSKLSGVIDEIRRFSPTCVVHAAASGMQFPKPKWFNLIHFNVNVSIDLCELVSKIPDCRFIFISTGLVYRDQGRALREEDPIDTLHPYGASKAAADVLVRAAAAEFNVPLTVLRPFSFTGLWDDGARLFPSILRAAAEGRPMALSPCDQLRDHCSARDIAAGIYAAFRSTRQNQRGGDVYNLGSGSMQPLRRTIEQVISEIGLRVELNFGAAGYGKYEPKVLVADTEAAKAQLGWTPRHNLAHAVWQLARESFPTLDVIEPAELLPPIDAR